MRFCPVRPLVYVCRFEFACDERRRFCGRFANGFVGRFGQRFTSLKEDANFAAFYLSSLAIGVVLVSKNGSSVDLLHLLFGSVLAVDIPALQLIAISASVTILLMAVMFRPLVLEA